MEENNQLATQQPQKTSIALSSKGVTLNTLDELWRFSTMVAQSGMAPKGMEKPESIVIALQLGMEVGLTPMASLQNIAVINGRPTIWGDGAMALVQGSPLCEYINEYYEGEGENLVAYCAVKRTGQKEHLASFSYKEAKHANLIGKSGPWTTYPKRMLMMRSRGFALRDKFSDLLKGIKTAEEVIDYDEISSRTMQKPVEEKANAVANTLKNVVSQIAKPAAKKVEVIVDTPTEFKMVETFEDVSEVIPDEVKEAVKEVIEEIQDPYDMETLKAMELDELKGMCIDNVIDYNQFEGKNTCKKLATLLWEKKNGMPFTINAVSNAVIEPVAAPKAPVDAVVPKEAKVAVTAPKEEIKGNAIFDNISDVGVTGTRTFPQMKALYSLLEDNLYSNDRLMVGIKKCGFGYISKEQFSRSASKADVISVLQSC